MQEEEEEELNDSINKCHSTDKFPGKFKSNATHAAFNSCEFVHKSAISFYFSIFMPHYTSLLLTKSENDTNFPSCFFVVVEPVKLSGGRA